MPQQKVYNLNESVAEFFEFEVNGHHYRFRHMNTEELEELQKIEKDDKKSKEFMFSFIDKVDQSSPDFPEVAKKMIAPQWVRFREMIQTEFGGNLNG